MNARWRPLLALALSLPTSVALWPLGSAAAREDPPGPGGSYLGLYTRSNANVLEQDYAFGGITVTRVVENAPAEAAGLREGDILLRANGIELSHPDRLAEIVDRLPPGSAVRLRIERRRRVIERELRTVRRIAPHPDAREGSGAPETTLRIERRRLGIELRPADAARLRARGVDQRGGVELVAIAERSPLVEAGLAPGDVLLALDGEPIPSPDALIDFLERDPPPRALALRVLGASGAPRELRVPTYHPPFAPTRIALPPLFHIERDAQGSEYSFLLGALRVERFETGSRYRLLWLWRFETGATGALEPGRG